MITFDSLHTWEDLASQYLRIEAIPILNMYSLIEFSVLQCLDLENEDHDIQINDDMD